MATTSFLYRFRKQLSTRRYTVTVALFAICALPLAPQMIGETTYFTSYLSFLLFKNNLHEVTPGKFYRSGEMSSKELADTIRELGIRTVVDLRMKDDEPDQNGRFEQDTVRSTGATYVHIPFSSAKSDQRESLLTLLDTYDNSQLPILVHCSSGTHRSGVASALWLMEKQGWPVDKALSQLSSKFGFYFWERRLKSLFSGHSTLDQVLTSYRYESSGSPSHAESFRRWIMAKDLSHLKH